MDPLDYNYQSAGFDGFLSRSIDNTPQVTLDTVGPDSTQIRFDSSQLSGYIGSALQTPDTTINAADGVIIKNGKLTTYDDDGNQAMFNGAPYEKMFFANFDFDINILSSNLYVICNIPHGLSKAPHVEASIRTITAGDQSTLIWHPMPFNFRAAKSYYGGPVPHSLSVVVDYVDSTIISCRMDLLDIFGLSFIAACKSLKMVFYCYLNPQA